MAIIKKYKAQQVREGAGVIVNRVFGHEETKSFDPFLMLDYFDEKNNVESPGFPWHPHKGMETISYFLRGSGEHQDSMGNKGIIGEGELQWMSAGKGIMHQEMPADSKNGMQGFQFWVNLPAAEKLKEPEYQYIKNGEMKTIELDKATVRVIAGEYMGLKGPIDKSSRGITMLHSTIDVGSEIKVIREVGKQGFIFIFEGNGRIDDEEIDSVAAYTLSEGEYTLKAESKMEILFAEGTPINEPIAWYGPIVMNTKEEIVEAFKDIENGDFVDGEWK